MKIKDLLKLKDRKVVTVGPEDTVLAAVRKLVEHDRGSLPVCHDTGELAGIITERDIVRKCFGHADMASMKVEDVMTRQVAVGFPDDDLDYAISVMKQKRIRHLPIVENEAVTGMISMRDLLDVQLGETQAEIRYASLLPRRAKRLV
ncbi:MAG: CBS domain-containing protein [Chloroflexi bacterium]|nr:CBS domain-containing protein [Chloroflexota bacterium]